MSTMAAMSRAAWGLGSVYRRKDGRWVGQTEHQGVRRYVYGRTPAEVRKKLRQPDQPRTEYRTESVAEFLVTWLRIMGPPKLGIRTHDGYTAIVNGAILPVLGELPIATLGREDIEEAVSMWSKQRHPRTVAHYLACLRAALSKGVEWGYLEQNPALRVKTPRIPKGRAKAFTEDAEARFLEHAKTDDLYPLWLAAFRTGMRQGELLGLHWSSVSADEIRVERTLIRSKGDFLPGEPKTETSRRVIPIGPELAAVLAEYRKAQMGRAGKLDQGLVFATPAGSPLPNDRVSRRFSALCIEAGVPRLTMHATRHTFATRLLERGARIDVVMRLLGHSTITTTVNTYGHVTEDAKRSAVAMLEAAR
jgi:integrase